jgi:peptide/nickel transport system permease protein
VIAGARPALDGPIVIVIAAMLLGGFLGLAAGSLGGIVDALVSRWVDLMYSLPWLLVAIVLVGVLGAGYWQAVAVLVVLTAPYNARLIRAAALEQRSRPYVEAARVLGLSRRRILVIHIGSNIVPFVISICMLNFAFALLALSGLSFLGLGVPPGTPDWGEMVAESQKLIFQNPLAGLAPGLAIMATATSMTVVGDWLFQSLSGRSGR